MALMGFNLMSKSNATEIIAILWLIAGFTASGWWHGFFIGIAIANLAESMFYAYKERKSHKHIK
jgi:hypothetical protein